MQSTALVNLMLNVAANLILILMRLAKILAHAEVMVIALRAEREGWHERVIHHALHAGASGNEENCTVCAQVLPNF